MISLTKSLKGKPTAGDDDVFENLVKQCVQLIKGPLAHIYNLSLNSGVFPDIWKAAKVKPLYKKGNKYDMKNYRPISIIHVLAKLLERLMYNRKCLFYMKTRFCQKLKMVSGKANPLIQQFSHLLVGFRRPLINKFTPLEYLLIQQKPMMY